MFENLQLEKSGSLRPQNGTLLMMYFLVPVFSFVGIAMVTALLVSVWIRISLRKNIMDVPTHRSSHTTATPRGGGTGIVTVVVVALIVGTLAIEKRFDFVPVGWAAGLGLVLAGISFVDDLRSLSSILRLVCHLAIAGAAVAILGPFPGITLPFIEPIALPHSIALLLSIVWTIGMTNVYNFMDGIDGIAGGQGIIAGLAWAVLGQVLAEPKLAWFGLSIAASCTGFLMFNWSPAKVFMGDVGSAFLGFMFAILPLYAVRLGKSAEWSSEQMGAVPMFGVLVVWPFVGDGVFTFVRRLINRENVFEAHRSHLYQRLSITGWSHSSVSSLYIAWALASAALGATYLFGDDFVRLIAGTVAATLAIGMFSFVKLRENLRAEPATTRAHGSE